jgi:hypothetical protein
MMASVVEVGIPAVQLLAVCQEVLEVPFQLVVWAVADRRLRIKKMQGRQ